MSLNKRDQVLIRASIRELNMGDFAAEISIRAEEIMGRPSRPAPNSGTAPLSEHVQLVGVTPDDRPAKECLLYNCHY